MRPTYRTLAPLALAALALAACNRKRAAETPAPSTTSTTADTDAARRDSIAREDAARRDREARDRAAREAAERAERERVRTLLEAPVYFAFDQSDLDSDARRVLDQKLVEVNRDAGVQLRITGHTDERGSDEYNVALGMRRAAAARRYLVQRGVAESRLSLASRGEEEPVCTGSDESCWSRNRRAAFEITAGGPVASRD